jgi:hypothetical protein
MTAMKIELTFGTLPDGSNQLTGFYIFWLMYVHGFSPHFHCQKSLRGNIDPFFHKKMEIGKTYELREPFDYHYIYLCGITAKPYRECGLHLAVQPEEGAVTHLITYNKIPIEVTNARQLEFQDLPADTPDLGDKFRTCRNWQFGYSKYGMANFRGDLYEKFNQGTR